MNAIMDKFEAQGHPGFPRIIGIIDGTHIRIRAKSTARCLCKQEKNFIPLLHR